MGSMTGYYKLVRITDHNDADKIDESAKNRIGRIFHIERQQLIFNKRLFLNCYFPGFHKSITTSYLLEVGGGGDFPLILKTENSIYYFKEVMPDLVENNQNEK